MTRARKFACPCGRHKPVDPHIGFCESHKTLLQQFREERLENTGQHQRIDQGRKRRPPTCCQVGCEMPRPKTEKYCLDHRDLEIE